MNQLTTLNSDASTMDLSAMFSNDQIAIMGCFAALAVCGLMAAVSFHVGAAGKSSVVRRSSDSLAFPETAATRAEERKAA